LYINNHFAIPDILNTLVYVGNTFNHKFTIMKTKSPHFLFIQLNKMIFKKQVAGLFAFLFLSLLSFTALQAQPGGGESVFRDTLSNGLRVIIVKNDLAPVVSTELNYLVGSNEVPAGFPGTAHAVEHMMFRGSEGMDANQLADISAGMGGDFDADTRQTVTQYYFTVPAEDMDIALKVESIRMRSILCTDSLWKNERGAIEQEVAADMSNPQYVFYTKLLKALFKGTPYEHDALGSRPTFDKTTAAMLKKFHDTWYAPNNAVLIIVGHLDPQKTFDEVKQLFGDIPMKVLPERPVVKLQPIQSDTLNLTTDLPYGLAVLSFRMPGTKDPDYPAAQILADVLSSQRSDLYGLVPAGKALYAGFEMEGLPQAGLGYALGVFPKGADAPALIKDMKGVLTGYLKNGLPADLVEAAKRHEIADAEFQKNSISGLANVWSEAVAVDQNNSPDEELDMLKKVTVEDVDRVAKKYLDIDHAIYAVLTPQPSGKPVSRKGFGGQESFAPKNPKAVELPAWADQLNKQLHVPPSVVNPVVYKLDNGIKLIVQPEDISNTVSVYGAIKNNSDLETPKGEEGVDDILSQLFSYGSTTYNRLDFQQQLDDIGANENAGTDFSLQVISDHFDRGVQLLADNLLHPALPDQAFQIVKMQTSREVAGEVESPDFLTHLALLKALLPSGDPEIRHSTPQSVDSVTLAEVHAYYDKVFRPDLTTIVVAGKVEPEQVKAVIEKYFGDWKAAGQPPVTDYSSAPDNKPSTTAVPDRSRVQDNVTLAHTLGLVLGDPDYYALQLGNHVLGGGFYATRFYKDLRENAGLVYYVGSSFDIGKTRSTYQVHYSCDPPNVSKARSIIVRDLKQMQDQPITEKELKQAQSTALRDIQLSESSLGSIANGLLNRSVLGLPLDQPTITAKHYLQITPAEIQAAFKKWVRPDDFVQVTQGPTPQ
jgi:zinc protease